MAGRALSALVVAGLLSLAGTARAAITVYANQAAFLAAVSAPATDSFNDLPLGGAPSPLARAATIVPYSYTAASTSAFYMAGTLADVWLSTINATDTITFGAIPPNVRGIGGFFFATDVIGDPAAGNVTLIATDGSGPVTQTIVGATTSSFVGFVSDGALTSLKVNAEQVGAVWPTVNNLVLAAAHAAIPVAERTVLLNLYTSTGGPAWSTNTNWNGASGTECTWHGVTCNVGGTSVTGIDLHFNNLTGSLPGNLQNLTNLASFDVYSNHLTGSIPALTGLTNLSSFWVSSNQLTGPIPALTGLTNLAYFVVTNNQLTGSIPVLTGLTNLNTFISSNNLLTWSIPALAGLTNLTYFVSSNNPLAGSIPALSGLTTMVDFEVSNNQLTGTIPALTGLTNLTFFRVSGNQLTGSIPALTGLTNVFDFEANNNLVTGSIPALTDLTNMFYFWAHDNQLTGSIPALTGLTSLIDFKVNANQLTGPIPALTGLTNLGVFQVSYNQLSGNAPTVPSPNSLVAGGSALCPNFLIHTQIAAWDIATGDTPWFNSCTGAPPPALLGTVSRKVHGAAGAFNLPLAP